MQGWVDLCYVKANRPWIEPAIRQSQVQRPTAALPRNAEWTTVVRFSRVTAMIVDGLNEEVVDTVVIRGRRWPDSANGGRRSHWRCPSSCVGSCRVHAFQPRSSTPLHDQPARRSPHPASCQPPIWLIRASDRKPHASSLRRGRPKVYEKWRDTVECMPCARNTSL